MFSERYDEAERHFDVAVDDARRRGSSVGFAAACSLRSLLHYRRGRSPRPRPTAPPRSICATTCMAPRAIWRLCAELGRVRRAGAWHGRAELLDCATTLRHPAVRGPALQPGVARARLAEGRAGQPGRRIGRAAGVRRARAEGGLGPRRSSPGGLPPPRSACGSGGWSRRARWRPRRSRWRARSARRGRSGSRCAHPRWPNRAHGGSSCCARRSVAGGLPGGAGAGAHADRPRCRAGPRRAARGGARAAAGRAGRCGGLRRDPLVERAHRELLATGARPRRTAAAGRDELTPSELRVTEMAAAGQDQPRDRAGAVRDREEVGRTSGVRS